jgi:hypothetical protein
MINFNFGLDNPFSNRFENVYNKNFKVSKNKTIEIEICKDRSIISFDFRVTTRQDHGGVFVAFGFLGYDISFNLYDNRHWDNENGCYINHGE